jgi:hypothetical protein
LEKRNANSYCEAKIGNKNGTAGNRAAEDAAVSGKSVAARRLFLQGFREKAARLLAKSGKAFSALCPGFAAGGTDYFRFCAVVCRGIICRSRMFYLIS